MDRLREVGVSVWFSSSDPVTGSETYLTLLASRSTVSGVGSDKAFSYSGPDQAAAAKAGTALSFAFGVISRVYVVRDLNGHNSVSFVSLSKPVEPV